MKQTTRAVAMLALTAITSGALSTTSAAQPSGSLSTPAVVTAPSPATTGDRITITNTERKSPPVSPGLVGANQRWTGNADFALVGPDDASAGFALNTDIANLAREMGLAAVRYSGGTVANLFNWKNANGKPGCQTSAGFEDRKTFGQFAELPPGSNKYTIQKNAEFNQSVGSTPNLLIPMINQRPADAARYVRAVVDANPGLGNEITVEIGNEPYNGNQFYWRSQRASETLDQYIRGGSQRQALVRGNDNYKNNLGLFDVKGCELRTPAKGTGKANQRYRPRFVPFEPKTARVSVRGERWEYRAKLTAKDAGKRVFTTNAAGSKGATRVVFGNGKNGAKPAKGAKLAIRYTVTHQPGFKDFYQALQSLEDSEGRAIDVNVCSSWARPEFIKRMRALGLRYDCLAAHPYAKFNNRTPGSDGETHDFLQSDATSSNKELAKLRRASQKDSTKGAKKRFLIVTEYGILNAPKKHAPQDKFMDSVYRARLMIGQIEAGVRRGNISNFKALFDEAEPQGSGQFSRSHLSYLLSWVGRMAGEQPVKAKRLNAPAGIDVVATRSATSQSLLVVNSSTSAPWSPEIGIPGVGSSCVAIRTMADGISASTLGTPTTDGTPVLPPAMSKAVAPAPDGRFQASFAAPSVTLLQFTPKQNGAPCDEAIDY